MILLSSSCFLKAIEDSWKIQITLRNSPAGMCRFRVFYKGLCLTAEGGGEVNVVKYNSLLCLTYNAIRVQYGKRF